MPNVRYAFPEASTWLKAFPSQDVKINVIEVSDTLAGPAAAMRADVLIALAGEYDPAQWEPLWASNTKIQIHFWPMTRGRHTEIDDIKDLLKEGVSILQDENDLLSRTGLTILDALEALNGETTPNLKRRHEMPGWPPYNAFRDGEQLNTILLPLINYNPNPTLLKVIQYASRQSIDISDEIRLAFFKKLNSLQSVGGDWPLTRISNPFYPGILPQDFLGLGQRQLFPVQTTAEVFILINKQPQAPLTDNDRRLLLDDLKRLYAKLSQEAEAEMNAETKAWVDPKNLSASALDRVWKITQKSRWALLLCSDQQLSEPSKKKLSRFVRAFSDKTEDVIDYRRRVRFRELDFLLDPNDFWAINNLVDIYNKVGNHAGAWILANKIIDLEDPDNLTIDIPHEPNAPIQDRERQRCENCAKFLENYALALENLNIDDPQFPRFVRKVARDLRERCINQVNR
jgi:hypothetical protein